MLLLIIDVAHAFWRAWHARQDAQAPLDRAAGIVRQLAEGWRHVAIAVDSPPYERLTLSPAYKSRRANDAEGRAAFRTLVERLRAEGWRIVEAPGHEADDIVASLARACAQVSPPVQVTVATGDKDLWTLLGLVRVVDLEGAQVTREMVAERFEAIAPDQLADLLAIAGDDSDDIAGVPQLGAKRAAAMLKSWGSLAAMLAEPAKTADDIEALRKTRDAMKRAADKSKKSAGADGSQAGKVVEELTEKIALLSCHARLHEHRAAVELARDLVRLRTDLPVRRDLEAIFEGVFSDDSEHEPDPPRAAAPALPPKPREEPRPVTDTSTAPTKPAPQKRGGYTFAAARATRTSILLRAGFCGAGGSGKSFTALAVAAHLADRLKTGPAYVIDSENGSALRYAKSTRTGKGFDFMHVPMPTDDYSPAAYTAALDYCVAEGAKVILIDSLSHEWEGPRGVLEQVDEITEAASKGSRPASAFSSGWKEMTPIHQRLIQRILSAPAHVLFTLRAKIKYEMKPGGNGKLKPEKTGEGPVQRQGIEYEPDLFFWMADAVLTVDKTRCDRLEPGSNWPKPGAEFAGLLADWIEDSVDPMVEALDQAVAASTSPDAYKVAKARLIAWCEGRRVPHPQIDAALDQLKARVAAANGKAA